MEAARAFVSEHVLSEVEEIISDSRHVDPKSKLQEISQAEFGSAPEYVLLAESGLDHVKTYEVAAVVAGKTVGTGSGSSKKKAQSVAAENALVRLSEWFPAK